MLSLQRIGELKAMRQHRRNQRLVASLLAGRQEYELEGSDAQEEPLKASIEQVGTFWDVM